MIRRGAPDIGEHTDAILAEAGFDADEIRGLHDTGAVAEPSATPVAEPTSSRPAVPPHDDRRTSAYPAEGPSPYHRRMSLRWDHEPVLHDPVVVAAFTGWNDAGDAASDAVDWLAARFGAPSSPASTSRSTSTSRRTGRRSRSSTACSVTSPGRCTRFARRGHARRRARPRAAVGTGAQLRWRGFCGIGDRRRRSETGAGTVVTLGACSPTRRTAARRT